MFRIAQKALNGIKVFNSLNLPFERGLMIFICTEKLYCGRIIVSRMPLDYSVNLLLVQ